MKVALLGCGRIAQLFHLGILARMPGAELGTIAEPAPPGRAAARSAAGRAAIVADWREAVADPAVVAVVVTLPNDLHAEVAWAAFEAGKHVYLEKPIATSSEGAARVVAAWKGSGAVGMTGFQGRFDPVVLQLRRAVADEALGRLVGARIAIGSASRELPGWKRHRASGGGVLLDLGSHAVDLARFLFGREVLSAHASVVSFRTEEDTAALVLTLEGDLVVQAYLSLVGVQENVIEIVGERGALTGDRHARTVERRPLQPPYGRLAHARRRLSRLGGIGRAARDLLAPPDPAVAYRRALTAFVRAVAGEAPRFPDIEDGRRSLEVVLSAEASAREPRAVSAGGPGWA